MKPEGDMIEPAAVCVAGRASAGPWLSTWCPCSSWHLGPLQSQLRYWQSSVPVLTLTFPRDEGCTFDSFIGMDCPPPNWNEGLNPELTKDLHLISQFHNLFQHMLFAITDFIYVRKFRTEINVEIKK